MCCKSQHAGRPAHKHACKTPGLLDRSSPNFKRSSGVFDSVDACIHVAILPSIVKRQRFEWRRAIQKCSVLINLHPVLRMTDNNTFLYTAINIPVFMPLPNYNAWWKRHKSVKNLPSRYAAVPPPEIESTTFAFNSGILQLQLICPWHMAKYVFVHFAT